MAGSLDNFRVIVQALPEMEPITVRGVEYTGPQLAWLVAINPELAVDEANRTPQLVFELGRLCAAALADYEVAEAKHVAWKEGLIYQLATDPKVAKKHGLIDDVGDKMPAKGVCDSYVHSLDEYVESKANMFKLAEAHRVLLYAVDAAKLRRDAIFISDRSGGSPPPRSRADLPSNGEGTSTYHQSYGDVIDQNRATRKTLAEQEAEVGTANQARTPLPTSYTAGPPPTLDAPPEPTHYPHAHEGPPGPPPAPPKPPTAKKKAPPPPRKGT